MDKWAADEARRERHRHEVRMAKVGIMALIDDACGYTKERPKDALRMELARLELNDAVKEE